MNALVAHSAELYGAPRFLQWAAIATACFLASCASYRSCSLPSFAISPVPKSSSLEADAQRSGFSDSSRALVLASGDGLVEEDVEGAFRGVRMGENEWTHLARRQFLAMLEDPRKAPGEGLY